MYFPTHAIVLSSLRYSETSLIVHCYTREFGFCSYLLKGILKRSKAALKPSLFQPLTQLEMVASHRGKDTLEYIKEAKVKHHYTSLSTDMMKNAQAYFLADICRSVLREEPQNEELFQFLSNAFLELDKIEYTANFHHKFLIEMTRYLGFYPGLPTDDEDCFNMEESSFEYESIHQKNSITGDCFHHFVSLLESDQFDCKINYHREDRNQLLEKILQYYSWHLPNFRTPDSLEILQSLFI